jgi:hypothetical protein
MTFIPDRKHPSKASYGDGFRFHTQIIFVPLRKHAYVFSRPVTGIALLCIFIYMIFVPHSRHGPPQPVMGIGLLFMYMMLVPHRKHSPLLPVTETAFLLQMKQLWDEKNYREWGKIAHIKEKLGNKREADEKHEHKRGE